MPDEKVENLPQFEFEIGAASEDDVAYANRLFGSAEPELLKFKNAILAKVGRNLNGDGIQPHNLPQLESSLPLMAIDDEHKERRVVGFIVNPHVAGDTLYIDGLVYARRFPEIADGIIDSSKKLSIEAFAETARCSVCGQDFKTERDYCEHLLGRRTGKATRLFADLKGVGAGIVDQPAEPAATFDGNHVYLLASMVGASAEAAMDQECEPDMADPNEKNEMEEACGDKEKIEESCSDSEPIMEANVELDELKATLARVQAELEAKSAELVTAAARISELEAKAEADKTAYERGLELISAGYKADEVSPILDALRNTDRAIFEILKASRGLVPAVAEKPAKTPNAVLGGDQDSIDLSVYSDIFA